MLVTCLKQLLSSYASTSGKTGAQVISFMIQLNSLSTFMILRLTILNDNHLYMYINWKSDTISIITIIYYLIIRF